MIQKYFSKIIIFALLIAVMGVSTSAKQRKPRLLQLTSIHIVDRNGFAETISNQDRLQQFQNVDFLKTMPYQKILRIYERDSKGNVRSVVTSYYENGNPKQFLEILDGRASGIYREWHENGHPRISTKVVGGTPDITQAAEASWLFDDISQAWDEDNHLIAEIPYSQGTLEGVSTYYHSNGDVWKRVPYKKGAVDGIVEIFRDSGELLQQINFVEGRKDGIATRYWNPNLIASYEEFYNGILKNGQYYDVKGELIAEVKEGLGCRAIFGKDKISELQQYSQGILEGEVKVFTNSGKLKRCYHVHNSIKEGEEVEYYDQSPLTCDSPQPKISFSWKEGKVHGISKTWYANGVLESQKEMSNNKKHGLSTVWYEDNNLMMIEEYEQGDLVRGDYFRRGEKLPFSQVVKGNGTASLFDAKGNFMQKIPYVHGKPDKLRN